MTPAGTLGLSPYLMPMFIASQVPIVAIPER